MPTGIPAELLWPAVLLLSVAAGLSGYLARRRTRWRAAARGGAPRAADPPVRADGLHSAAGPAPLAATVTPPPPLTLPPPAGAPAAPAVPDVPAALLRIDSSGALLEANPAWHALLGWPAPLASGQLLTELAPPSCSQALARWLAELLAADRAGTLELKLLHADGRALDIHLCAAPAAADTDAGGAGLVLAFHDLTALRRHERALAFREARYRALVDDQPDLVSLATSDGILTFVNRAYATQFGMAAEALVGRSLYEFIDEADRVSVRRHLRNVFATGKLSTAQNRLVDASGRVLWVEWINRALPDSEGRMNVLHSVGRDITERLQAERAIQMLNHEQTAILNSDLIGIAKIRNRHFLWASRGLARIFGLDPGRLAGASTRMLYFDEADYERVEAEAYPLIRAGGTYRGELRIRNTEGEPMWLEASGVMFDAVRDESLWVYTDVTARKRAELALRETLELEATQRRELAAFRDAAEAESELAHFLLQRLSRAEQLDASGVACYRLPAETFSGDLIAVASSNTGELYGMLADATGHGLAAAINLIPLSSAFYAMAAKGFNLTTISEQLNQVVKDYSLPDRFVAVTLARFLVRERRLEIVNAGNPAALLLTPAGEVLREFASASVPFGVLDRSRFRPRVEAVVLQGDEQLLLHSDGVVEACSADGEPFGSGRLAAALRSASVPAARVDSVSEALARHIGQARRMDDISLLLLTLPALPGLPVQAVPASTTMTTAPADPGAPPLAPPSHQAAWAVALHFSAEQLRSMEAVPVIVELARTLGLTADASARFFTVLSELFGNALDHGVLGLDSAIKSAPGGFERYESERERRLQALQRGHIQVDLWHSSHPEGRSVAITVTDSGAGFDHRATLAGLAAGVHHREGLASAAGGLPLLYSLCDRIEFNESGNSVSAEFRYH